MQQHSSFEQQVTSIQNYNHILDKLQQKMNSYFNNSIPNPIQHYKNIDDENIKDSNLNNLIHSQNNEEKRMDDSEQDVQIFRRNSINGYTKIRDGRGQEQLQFKIYTNNKNKNKNIRNTKSQKDYNISQINNVTTKTQQGFPTASITEKQSIQDKRERESFNPKMVDRVSLKNGKKSQEFRLFQRPSSVQKGRKEDKVVVNKEQQNGSQENTNKNSEHPSQKKQNLLSDLEEDRIVVQINTNFNSKLRNRQSLPNNPKYTRFSPHKQQYIYESERQSNNFPKDKPIFSSNISKKNQENISLLGNIGNSSIYEKNRNKLVSEMQTVQILMKERLDGKKRLIKQIQQEISTQNQERVHLYKINVRLNQQLKMIQQEDAAHDAQLTSNQVWKKKMLEEEVEKLKKQMAKKKQQRKHLRKQQQALREVYQTTLNNKKNTLKRNIQNIEQNKVRQNTQVLKDLIKQLDKLKGVVEQKIKNKSVSSGNANRKVIKSFKN